MMDDDQTATESEIVRDLTEAASAQQEAGLRDHIVVPKHYKLLDMNEFGPEPRRINRSLDLWDLDSWLAYTKEFTSEKLRLYRGNHNEPYLRAVFDDHTPGSPAWREHSTKYVPLVTDEWRAWERLFERQIEQGVLVDHLEDTLPDIVSKFPDGNAACSGADMMLVAREFKAHTKAEFRSEVDLHSGSFGLTYDETVRGATKSGKMQVPEAFAIRLPMWEGRPPVHLKVRLRFKVRDGELSFTLVPDQLPRVKRQEWDLVLEAAQGGLGPDAVFLR